MRRETGSAGSLIPKCAMHCRLLPARQPLAQFGREADADQRTSHRQPLPPTLKRPRQAVQAMFAIDPFHAYA